ncbi:hypothetical protein [Flavobacterium sp.]|uniref:hypothetical protein n=1 Tax=Flavobacterium sp. TaxID=239 RepID=UPI0031DE3A1A
MINKKCVLVRNIFFLSNKNILIIKGLDEKDTLTMLEYSLFLNNILITKVSFSSEFFIEKKKLLIDERAFECKDNLDQLKGIDLTLNTLCIFI